MKHRAEERIRRGCGAAVLRDGLALLLRRRMPPEAGHWGLPGGKIDWLEPVETAVRREIAEETGLELGALDLPGVVDRIDRSPGRSLARTGLSCGTAAEALVPSVAKIDR